MSEPTLARRFREWFLRDLTVREGYCVACGAAVTTTGPRGGRVWQFEGHTDDCLFLAVYRFLTRGDDMSIERYTHHGRVVSVQAHLKGKHRGYCLCWKQCIHFRPGQDDNCPTAAALFALDMEHGLTTPVFECPSYYADPCAACCKDGCDLHPDTCDGPYESPADFIDEDAAKDGE